MRDAVHAYRTPEGWRTDIDYAISLEPTEKRVRALFGGETVVDTTDAVILHETRHLPVYYFPRDDVNFGLLKPTNHSTHCPHKGDATYWTVKAGGREAENAVWAYEHPFEQLAPLKDLVALYWGKMDQWFEEDEEVFVHPRDPYTRIDVRESHRPVRVVLNNETVAETVNAQFLFETGLPVRYYIPKEDVRMDLLTPSETRTACPYKGEAIYWSATINGETIEDIVWSYPDPVDDMPRIRDLMCFYTENVDEIYVDAEEVEKPRTKWSR